MKLTRFIPLFVALALPAAARADFAASTAPTASPQAAAAERNDPSSRIDDLTGIAHVAPAAAAESDHGLSLVEVPGGPGSASLVLWALGGLGAWQLSRNGRKLHLSIHPDWYHAGGPQQIGHTFVFDLQFTALTPSAIDLIAPPAPRAIHLVFDSRPARAPDLVPTRAPRAPPCSCSQS